MTDYYAWDFKLVEKLLLTFGTDESLEAWLDYRHPAFGGVSARSMVANGRSDEVMAELERIDSGMAT